MYLGAVEEVLCGWVLQKGGIVVMDVDDRETTIAILNSQNAVVYEEITGIVRKFPLPAPNSYYNLEGSEGSALIQYSAHWEYKPTKHNGDGCECGK